ncbi:MAG: DUF2497 domain-containing protein [Holosporales bacterium]|jgi:cell pole-organizing protein PopZ|nr:DUF2497 domain-containing protein [Holosporales bacterium]
MNLPNGKGGGKRQVDEMSMEDILLSIRKYVAEEVADSPEKINGDELDFRQSQAYQSGLSSGSIDDDNVISLSEDYVVTNAGVMPPSGAIDLPPPQTQAAFDQIRYTEQSDLDEDLTNIAPKKSGPFDKLTDALKSYGKEKGSSGSKKNIEKEVMCKFFEDIATEVIKQWIANNLREITTELVAAEIEKLKAEG